MAFSMLTPPWRQTCSRVSLFVARLDLHVSRLARTRKQILSVDVQAQPCEQALALHNGLYVLARSIRRRTFDDVSHRELLNADRAAVRSDDLDLPSSSAAGESRVASGQWGPVVLGWPMCRRVVEPRR